MGSENGSVFEEESCARPRYHERRSIGLLALDPMSHPRLVFASDDAATNHRMEIGGFQAPKMRKTNCELPYNRDHISFSVNRVRVSRPHGADSKCESTKQVSYKRLTYHYDLRSKE